MQQRLIYGGKQMCVLSPPLLHPHTQVTARADKARTTRSDDKTAEEYNLEGGATLHLVLALRGGS